MGTPNNQKPRTARDVLRDIIRGTDHSVAESDLRATTVDLDLLEATYETDIRPHLDYLHGYKPLEELDPIRNTDRPGKFNFEKKPAEYIQSETWLDVLGRFGQLNQHRQVLTVLDICLYCYNRKWSGPKHVRIRISLTRKGTWLFWYIVTGHEGAISKSDLVTEQLSVHQTVRELWQKAHKLVPDSFSINFRGNHRPETVPLSIEQGLRHLLQHTIEEREKRLEDMKRSLASASERVSIIAYRR